ncbi:MAG: hypothetical protein AAGH79_04360 [Bacteroidota bacterium]
MVTCALLVLILLIGIGLRIWAYWQNPSLFLDEANLARNVAERSFEGFFRTLDYHQYAPPLFMSLVKGATLFFGQGEWGLRFWPLLAGVGALVLFWILSKEWNLSFLGQFYGLALFAGSGLAILYSVSTKQYSTDMLITLLLIYLADRDLQQGHLQAWKRWIWLGVLAPWISMPSMFLLSGVGLAFGWASIRQNESWAWTKEATRWVLTGLTWLGSFGLYYWLLLRSDIESDFLQQWHQDYFLPLLPLSAESWEQFSSVGIQVFKAAFGFTSLAIGLGLGLFILGITRLVRDPIRGCLLLIPLLACWVASALQQYSMMPRLLSFAFPVIWLVAAWGITFLLEKTGPWLAWILLPLLIASLSVAGVWKKMGHPVADEGSRQALDILSEEWQMGDGLFVFRWAEPAYAYYQQHHPDKERYQFHPWYHNPTSAGFEWEEAKKRLPETNRTWLLYTHMLNDTEKRPMLTDINQIEPTNNVSIILSIPGTYLYLIRPNE